MGPWRDMAWKARGRGGGGGGGQGEKNASIAASSLVLSCTRSKMEGTREIKAERTRNTSAGSTVSIYYSCHATSMFVAVSTRA